MKKIRLLVCCTLFISLFAQAQPGSKLAQWYEKANDYLNTGNYKDAIAWYTKVIDAGGYELAYFNRAQCYLQTDDIEHAMMDLRYEQLRNPDYAPAFYRYGYYSFYFTDSTQGIDYIRQGTQLDTLDYFGYLVGGIYFGINKQKDSMEHWMNHALNVLIDSQQIEQIDQLLSFFATPARPLLVKERERIKKVYESLYISYIESNQYLHDLPVYYKTGDGEKVITSTEYMYLHERESYKPRKDRLYYALTYFHNLGLLLYKQGNYAVGQVFLDYEMRIATEINENDAYALVWSDKGFVHYHRAQYDSALICYHKYFTYEDKNPDSSIARAYSTMVSIYCTLAQYDSASYYAQKSLTWCNPNDYDTRSIVLNNVGMFYSQTGNYEEALKLYKQAADLAIQLKDTSNLTLFYNNIGSVYQADGRYDQAESWFLKAKSINTTNRPQLSVILSNLGYLHIMWGNYKKAVEYCNEALSIAIEDSIFDRIALILNNISVGYRNLNQPDEAKKAVKQAIALFQKVNAPDLLALGYLNLGNLYGDKQELDSALYFYNKALEINLKLNKKTELGMDYDVIGSVYFLQKKYDEAEASFLKSIEYDEASGRSDRLAPHYGNLATMYAKQKKYEQSETYYRKCIALFEEIRKTATGSVRREYFAQVISNYQLLSLVQQAQKHYEDAFATMELSKAKLLGEQLSLKGEDFHVVTLDEVRKSLPDSTAIYFYNTISDQVGYGFFIDKSHIVPLGISDDSLHYAYAALLHIDDPESVTLERIVNDYRSLLLIPEVAKRSSTLLVEPSAQASPELREKVAHLLFNYFFEGLTGELSKYKQLIIVPDGIANFLPFESLLDTANRYLAESMAVGYIQSMSVESRIAQRKYSNNRKPMIAFGGAEYVSNAGMALKTKEAREAARKTAETAIASRGNLSDSYNKLGYGSWQNLPGTIIELQELKKIVADCDEYTGKNVDEAKIKALSAQGKLKNYRVIHFATHGMVVPEVPELSALVLTQTNTGSTEDNYLRADEISQLELNADFVALSACETGLGKIYNGDGVVGLTQAFMIAGANSLAVSLWQVADQSTSQFMSGIYRISATDHNYMNAIAQMKKQFISGAFGEKYIAPYYWAPFIFYGR